MLFKKKLYIVLCRPLVIVFLVFFLFSMIGVASHISHNKPFEVIEKKPPVVYTIEDEIQGTSAIIYDLSDSHILAQKNPFIPMPIASITKLTAVVTAYPLLSVDDVSEITDANNAVAASTSLRKNSRWGSLELLKYSLITSSNLGIHSVGRTIHEKVGEKLVDKMNSFARTHRLVQTHFINETGLDAHGSLSGSESSAYDIAMTARLFFQLAPQFASETSKKEESFYSLSGEKYIAENTNKLVGTLEYPVYLSKTGYTDIAGGTLVMVVEVLPGHLIAAVVLGSTKRGRFDDMLVLFDIAKALLTGEIPPTQNPEETIGPVSATGVVGI